MPLVSQSVPSFKGGVSQQPDIIRFPDQVSELVNGYPSEVDGLQKRPPTMHIARLGDTSEDVSGRKYHIINRDETEQYILEMGNRSLRIWDLQGNPKKVKIENDIDYLNSDNPQKDFRAVTVADYTFILNRTKKVDPVGGMSSAGLDNTSFAYIKNAQYAKSYGIFIDNQFICGVLTPDGGAANQAVQTTTAFITRGLFNLLTGTKKPDFDNWDKLLSQVGGAGTMKYARSNVDVSKYNFWLVGDSVLVIQRKEGTGYINLQVNDGFGNQNALAYNGNVSAVNKLPPYAPDGYIMQIAGEKNTEDDNYFVKWDEKKRLWRETVAPRIPYQISSTNMPHALVREADGSFTFKNLKWSDRAVGNEDSNPDPSFIGKTINDIFFFRNRLGVISEESVILSGSNDFFNFWFNSATLVADTDPVDVSVSSNKVSLLTHAVPFSRELMLFSREGQFVLSSDGVMTPKSVKVDQITSFDYNPEVQPVSIGNNIFFINDRINFCSLMRYYSIQDFADLKDAEDVSSHVPTYIPTGITRISGNTTENTILLSSKYQTNTVYAFKFITIDNQTEQQSWFKWKFAYDKASVLMAEFVNAYIYMVVNTSGGLFLERTQLTGNALDYPDEPMRLFMDRKVRYEVSSSAPYDEYNDITKINFKDFYGSIPHEGVKYFIIDTNGYAVEVKEWSKDGSFTIKGDYRGRVIFVGRSYEFNVVLSQQTIRKGTSTGGIVAEDDGRLQLRYYWFNYGNSGVFDCCVDNAIKNKHFKYTFTGRNLGISTTRIGVNNLYTGRFKFPVQDLNTEVVLSVKSDNAQPLNIISGGWEGLYTRRNSGI